MPSGFYSPESYDDAHPHLDGDQGSDLKLADHFYEGVPGNPHYGDQKHKNLMWYLVTTSPSSATEYLRYKATALLASRRNVHKYNQGTKLWDHIPNLYW